jgi:hypothetical protein
MLLRAAAVWLLLLVIAVGAGTLRAKLLQPRVGERAAHQLGTLAVVALFAGVIWWTVGWIDPGLDPGRLAALGLGWAVATVVFEFGFGRWVAGASWSELVADYNVLRGRLWMLVLLTLLIAPYLAGAAQRS